MLTRLWLIGVLLLAVLPLPSFGWSADLGLSLVDRLALVAPDARVPVIVRIKSGTQPPLPATLSAGERRRAVVRALRLTSEKRQRSLRRLLKQWHRRYRELWIINGLALNLTPAEIEILAAMPEVESIRYDTPLRLIAEPVQPLATVVPNGWNLTSIGVDQVPGLSGRGKVVAVLDTGVDLAHPEFSAGSWRGNPGDWHNPFAGANGACATDPTLTPCDTCDLNETQPCDIDGHGTGVASLLFGQSLGVAPGAQWIAAKIFKDDGTTTNSIILGALQWALDPDGDPATTDDVPDVVNGSWGFEDLPGVCLQDFEAAIGQLKAAGIVVAFAAGNAGPAANTSISPANNANNFAVGSVGATETVSTFSSRGSSPCDAPGEVFPELVAPGESLTIAQPGGGYAVASGTSFSTPHVSGIMMLLLEGFPGTTPSQMATVLKTTAKDLGATGPDNDYGYGLVDALAAYQYLLPPAPELVAPADQASGLAVDLTLSWRQPSDPLGATVVNQVWLSTDPTFTGTSPIQVSRAATDVGPVPTPFLLLAVFLPPVWFRRQGKRMTAGLLLLLAVLVLTSCGGGGGSSAPPPDSTIRRLDVTGLAPATTYYWKVQATTDRGDLASESPVYSFTTQ